MILGTTMDSNIQDADMSTNVENTVSLTLHHHGKAHTFEFSSDATISDLSEEVAESLNVPPANQKFMVPKLGLLRPPFKLPNLLLKSLLDKKITLIGATAEEASSILQASTAATRYVNPHRRTKPVQAYKSHDWKKEQEESQYTFVTLRPLPYLPNPQRSLQFLQRLKDDAGIKAAMRKHKFTVPLLTEMNPIDHTQVTNEGTQRTLGLNRNGGEVIELRLRTDAYDGYRDYKTIRKTLCHEMAHNVFGPHDQNFWNLCKQIEKEVAVADWRSGGKTVGDEEYYDGGHEDEVHDEGGWTGGEYVLGAGKAGGAEAVGQSGQGMSRRDILAKAAEERMKKMREQQSEGEGAGSGPA